MAMLPFSVGLNAGFAAATNLLGVRLDPYLGCNFLVEIEGLLAGGFSEVSGLDSQVEFEEVEEGGRNDYTHKLPTRTKYPQNLVLTHGLTDLDWLWAWYDDVAHGIITRKNGTIFLLDRQRIPAMWWNFKDAYPVSWSGPQLQAGSGTVAVETVELVHRGISKPAESRAWSAARAAASLGGQLI